MGADSSIEPKPGSPSFFKVVRDPSSPLKLPIAFVRRYFDKIPKNPRLKTATGEHSWRLQIKKIGEDYCLADGWEKLAKDVELCIRDILVFWLIDSSTFQVSFFDEHGCEKDLPLNEIGDCNEDDDEHYDDDDGDDDNVSVTRDEDLYFQKVISTKTHRYQMLLPKKFVDDARIEKKKSIKLKNDEGKEWIISVRCESYKYTRYYLSTGWQLFLQYHELSDGDMCLFRYIRKEDVIILAQLIKSKRRTKPEADLEKKIGKPVEVKIEYDSDPEMLKRKRKRPVVEKQSGGCVEVESEDKSWSEAGFLKRKKTPPIEKPNGGGGVVVKIEDESDPPEVEVVNVDREAPPVVKAWGGGEEEKSEPVFRFDRVIYF